MDSQDGNKKRTRARPRVKYFFLDGELYRSLHINVPKDIITAWNYPRYKRVKMSYRFIKSRAEPAFMTREVEKFLNRKRLAIENAILRGDFEAPYKTYRLSDPSKPYAYLWSEKDILAAHDYFSSVHRGRPRKDGLITPMAMPTKAEVRAMMRGEFTLYEKLEDGTFVPTWKAEDFG